MAFSKHVSQLEETLREPLFERSTRSVRLTEFGRQFLEHAEHLVREQENLKDWVQNRHTEPHGTLRVVGFKEPLQAMVIPHVSEFRDHYPGVELEIDAFADLNDPLNRSFDVAWGISKYLGERYPGLVRRRILTTQVGVFASPHYLERMGTPAHPEALTNHSVIPQLHDQPNNFLIIEEAGRIDDGLPYCLLQAPVKSVIGHVELCIQGLGLINASPLMPEVRRAVAAGLIVPVLQAYWYQSLDLYLYYHQVRQRQAKVDAFVDFFANRMAELAREL